MSYVIGVSGKGGVGKTTLSALIVRRLIARGKTPILAVDADPNTCLDSNLGVHVEKSIGRVREDARKEAAKGLGAGISKQQMLELKIAESLVEAKDFDLIAMGRSEGPGCYCYANNVLKNALKMIADEYPYVVLDNEAGMENLSRRIVHKLDLLVMVADPSKRGLDTLKRLHEVTTEMEIEYDKLALIVNRMRRDELPEYAAILKEQTGADILIGIPDNLELADLGEDGHDLAGLPAENIANQRIDELLAGAGL
jgi:CO dehydrogenase maturation factor